MKYTIGILIDAGNNRINNTSQRTDPAKQDDVRQNPPAFSCLQSNMKHQTSAAIIFNIDFKTINMLKISLYKQLTISSIIN